MIIDAICVKGNQLPPNQGKVESFFPWASSFVSEFWIAFSKLSRYFKTTSKRAGVDASP